MRQSLKVQVHYTTGYLMIASLLILAISYLSKRELPAEFMLLLVISIVLYIFTEEGEDTWMT